MYFRAVIASVSEAEVVHGCARLDQMMESRKGGCGSRLLRLRSNKKTNSVDFVSLWLKGFFIFHPD